MPGPQDGSGATKIDPPAPEVAEDADVANPGQVEKTKADQAKHKKGKYGKEKVDPHKPPKKGDEEPEKELTWIEIELFDDDDNPVAGEQYRVTLPNGKVASGTLDKEGFARVSGFEKGTCKITFPNLDKDIWSFDQELPEKTESTAKKKKTKKKKKSKA